VRILTRYILGEILSHALIGLALFTFILFMPYLPNVLEMVVRNSSTFSDAAEIFLFTVPNLLRFTIPMAVLVGVLLGLSRLAADSEVVAMRASGLGIGYFVRVASIVAIGGTLLGLANSLYLTPRANQGILDMQRELQTSQASYQIQPRVFYEEFKNFVLYVQNVRSGTGASNWDQVFMAEVSDPDSPRVTTAASATVVSDSTQVLLMRLRNGAQHDMSPNQPNEYNISSFNSTDRPLELGGQGDVHLGRRDTDIYALQLDALLQRVHSSDSRRFQIELNKRFAFPASCLVLMLVGVPLGVASRRGGKSSGFVYAILLAFLYYFLSFTGTALGNQNKLPAFVAVWSANILFASVGIFLLWQMATGGSALATIVSWASRSPKQQPAGPVKPNGLSLTGLLDRFQPHRQPVRSRNAFPRILDEYVVREFLGTFLLVLSGFVLLMLVFTFFDLVGDIIRNHIPLVLTW
jgi:LPS export ABC transporter permease LptF